MQRQKILPPYPWEALFRGMPRDEAALKPHSVSWRAQGRVCSKDRVTDIFIINKAADLLSISKHGGICGSGTRGRQRSQHLSPGTDSLVRVRTREVGDPNSKIVMTHHPSCPHQPHQLSPQAVCQGRGSSSLSSTLPPPRPPHEKKQRRDNA